jgi:hypothetical protein
VPTCPHRNDEKHRSRAGNPATIGRREVITGGRNWRRGEGDGRVHRSGDSPPLTTASHGVRQRDLSDEVVIDCPSDTGPKTPVRPGRCRESVPVGMLGTTAPATVATIPSAMRRSRNSRNTNHAGRVVKTPSRSRFRRRTGCGSQASLRSARSQQRNPHRPSLRAARRGWIRGWAPSGLRAGDPRIKDPCSTSRLGPCVQIYE